MVSVWRGFLFLLVLGMGFVILLWHSLSLPYNNFEYTELLINTEIPKVTYYYVLILNLNLKCIINFLKVISIS